MLRPEYFPLPAILPEALPIKANDWGGVVALGLRAVAFMAAKKLR